MKQLLFIPLALSTIIGCGMSASADPAADALQRANELQQQQNSQRLQDQLQQQQQQQMQFQQQLQQQQQQYMQQQEEVQREQQYMNPNNPASPLYNPQATPAFNPGGILSESYSRAGLCRLGDATCPVSAETTNAAPESAEPVEAPAPRHHRRHRHHRTN